MIMNIVYANNYYYYCIGQKEQFKYSTYVMKIAYSQDIDSRCYDYFLKRSCEHYFLDHGLAETVTIKHFFCLKLDTIDNFLELLN